MTRVAAVAAAAAVIMFSLPARSIAQEARSVPLAKQLAAALDGAKLDTIAAADPSSPDTFVAALYFANLQLLVVSAKYTAPQLLTAKVDKKDYRDVYIDLNSASVPESKTFVEDLGADGLKAKRDDNQPFDT